MGKLEETIVESLTELRTCECEAERQMFVFPLSLMGPFSLDAIECDHAVVRGEVARMTRPAKRLP